MALDDAVRALAEQWNAVRALLDDDDRAEYDVLLRELTQADDTMRGVAANELIFWLAERLPPDHPVRRGMASDTVSLGTTAMIDLESAVMDLRAVLAEAERAVLADPDPLQSDSQVRPLQQQPSDEPEPFDVVGAVRKALLAVPSRSAAEVGGRGQDPNEVDLIRLRRPGGEVRLPAFQFDHNGRAIPVVRTINVLLGAGEDPWGVASWWLSANAWLDGTPAYLLGRASDGDLIAAARADLEVD